VTDIIRDIVMRPVKSSNLHSVGWKDGILIIKFNNRRVYQYPNVPQEIFEGLVRAESPGRVFHRYIYDQGWEYKEITDDLTDGPGVV
jgi:hypothetical protein